MSDQLFLGVLAIAIGVLASILLFVPFVAVSYRRRGRLTLGRTLMWVSALVYFWAIWTYTLLPLPDAATIVCAGIELDPMATVRDVQEAIAQPGNPLRQGAVLQVLLNVALFVPLGFFLRVLGQRGVVGALFLGLSVSAVIEFTQLTGIWGLYPCAYRVFDVGDLITNTSGAVGGSVLSLFVPRHLRGASVSDDADQPRPVTRGRRALAMLCDWLGFVLFSLTVTLILQLVFVYVVQHEALAAGPLASTLGTSTASIVWLAVVLITGRSWGDASVQLRYGGNSLPLVAARALRWLGGIGGIAAVDLLLSLLSTSFSPLYLLAILVFFVTDRGRGLPGVLSGMMLLDSREPQFSTTSRSPVPESPTRH